MIHDTHSRKGHIHVHGMKKTKEACPSSNSDLRAHTIANILAERRRYSLCYEFWAYIVK
jgi:hypothetical protein